MSRVIKLFYTLYLLRLFSLKSLQFKVQNQTSRVSQSKQLCNSSENIISLINSWLKTFVSLNLTLFFGKKVRKYQRG